MPLVILFFIAFLFVCETKATPPVAGGDRLGIPDAPLPVPISEQIKTIKILNEVKNKEFISGLFDVQSAPIGAKLKSEGVMRMLVVLVKTKEARAPFTSDYVRNLFFGQLMSLDDQKNASVADYYAVASLGKLRIEGTVVDWIDGAPLWQGAGDGKFIDWVSKEVKKKTELSLFDVDDLSPEPRRIAATDGNIDFLAVIYQDHRVQKIDFPYRSKYSMLNNAGGKPWKPVGESSAVGVEDFILVPARSLGNGDYRIGVVCHEVGHFLGLPDLYKRTGDQVPTDIGHWCLMCWGCNDVGIGNPPIAESAKFPPMLSAWCRSFLGWGKRNVLSEGRSLILDSAYSGEFAQVKYENNGDEQILIEFYSPPNKSFPWGKGILPEKKEGFLVWHVDEMVGRGKVTPFFQWPSTIRGAGQNDANFNLAIFEKNTGLATNFTGRPLVRLVAADNRFDLQNKNNMLADEGDVFSTSIISLPSARIGRGFYRDSRDISLELDAITRSVTWKGFAQAASEGSIGENVQAPREMDLYFSSRDTLIRVAIDPKSLENPVIKSNFTQIDFDKIQQFAQQYKKPHLLKLHQDVRTFQVAGSQEKTIPRELSGAYSNVLDFVGSKKKAGTFMVSEDFESVLKIGDVELPRLADFPIQDAEMRALRLLKVLKLSTNKFELSIDSRVRSNAFTRSTQRVPFSLYASIGGDKLPMALTEGCFIYSKGNQPSGFELFSKIEVIKFPEEIDLKISGQNAVDIVKKGFGDDLPSGTSFSTALELFPIAEGRGEWVLSHKVGIMFPGAKPVYAHIDARDGKMLKR